MKAFEVIFVFIFLFFLACGGPSVTNVANNENGTLFPVSVDDSWGFIDKQGDIVISLKYEGAVDFSEGRALIKKDGKWGYINPWDIMVITP